MVTYSDIEVLRSAAAQGRIHWHQHAFERFMEHGICRDEIVTVIMKGEVIETYPTDRPYPSCLILYAGRIPCTLWQTPIPPPASVTSLPRTDRTRTLRTGFNNEENKTMSDIIGHCPLCGGEKQLGTTTFAVDMKFGVVVVREVPAFVCTKCGDAWIDDPVAVKLEGFVAEARRTHTMVEITQWKQLAA